MRTLLLNFTYEPMKVISWQKAITMLTLGKVEVIDEYDEDIRSVTLTFKMPSVVRLVSYVDARHRKMKFCRRNVYLRDKHICQYCGKKFKHTQLTYDHVLPKAQGGRTAWENIVTACKMCNEKKSDRTPREAGMSLIKKPRKPEFLPILNISVLIRNPPDEWAEYLYWFDKRKK